MGNKDNAVGFGFLKYDDFVSFVDKNPYIKQIELSNSGEIFLNPDLLKIIKYAYEKGVKLSAYNGVNLNNVSDEVLEALVKYEFERITCSIDGTSQETYSQYRVGGDFESVISNIKKINKYKKLHDSTYPALKYQFIIFGHNEHEIPRAKELAKELNMEINFKFNWNSSYSPIKDEDFVRRETALTTKPSNDELLKDKKSYLRSMCVKMWTQPQINWDGRLLGCCVQFKDDYGVNVFDIGLQDALISEKFAYAKQMLMNKQPSREDISCSTCQYYLNMRKNDSFVTEEEILEYL